MTSTGKQLTTTTKTLTDYLEIFITEIAWTCKDLTVKAYCSDLTHFIDWLEFTKFKRLSSLSATHIQVYLTQCKSAGYNDASLYRRYISIRKFTKFLQRKAVLHSDITKDIPIPSVRVKAPRVPTHDDVLKILEQVNTETESGCRDRAMLELLYSSGLRASELCDLKVSDIQEGSVQVKQGKGDNIRTLPVTKSALHWISVYLDNYRDYSQKDYLFVTLQGKRIRRQLLTSLVTKYSQEAGISGVTAHTIRHACATHMFEQGADIRFLQEILGHAYISTTQRYTHLSSTKLQDMFKSFHPRDK